MVLNYGGGAVRPVGAPMWRPDAADGSPDHPFPRAAQGSGAPSASVGASGDPLIDGLLAGFEWTGASIGYSAPAGAGDYQSGYLVDRDRDGSSAQFDGFAHLGAQQLGTVRFALEDASGFGVEGFTALGLSYGGANGGGTIRVADTADNRYGYTFYPGGDTTSGDVWLGSEIGTPVAGNYSWNNTLHELGHALGLKHGHEVGGPATAALPIQYDSLEFTIMTYRSYVGGPASFSNEASSYPQTFMMLDIKALQHLYGADFTTNAGDTVYRWSPTTGQLLVNGAAALTPAADRVFLTVWDGGGTDTYDLSDYSTAVSVNLAPGTWSTFDKLQLADLGDGHSARGNVANALLYQGDPRSLVENAIGGTGDDTILGNQVANVLSGNAGGDRLTGGAGDDALVGGGGGDVLNGGTGKDGLTGGSEADLFLFGARDSAATAGRADVVADFSHADGDKISLRTIDARTATPDDEAFTFIGKAAFSGAGGEARLVFSHGDTFLQLDTGGDTAPELVIQLTGHQLLVAADLVL